MLRKFITAASRGETVYISDVSRHFAALDATEKAHIYLHLDLLESGKERRFALPIPKVGVMDNDVMAFVKSYVCASIYNILSGLGGRKLTVYADTDSPLATHVTRDLAEDFGIGLPSIKRVGYGRAINVIDRMMASLVPEAKAFHIDVLPLEAMPPFTPSQETSQANLAHFIQATQGIEDKTFLGIDIGGTDIKVVAVKNGQIDGYKEYDWFPAKFSTSKELVDPIIMLVRLMRAKVSIEKCIDCDGCTNRCGDSHFLRFRLLDALEKDTSDAFMLDTIKRVEAFLDHKFEPIHGIGLCFPDVVVRNKVVGGEVYKTRGIRRNPAIDYEADFRQLTDLNEALKPYISKGAMVEICNDGPMASYTAAVELAADGQLERVEHGVFAHTLGTELGTGWVQGDGTIPDIPLEVYNYIIDLGSYPERAYGVDDLRSINNFNTGLPGTLQKYCSQSGVFRLAMKYFPTERPDLYQELFDLGFAKEVALEDGSTQIIVPTTPVDQRKPFLEYMMALPEREKDEVNDRIWREIGEFLAVTWLETEKILKPETKSRYLFGRLVKRQHCFELMVEGARRVVPDLQLEVANANLAITPLMKQLEEDEKYTVAQFAQAIGAIYYANRL